MTITYKLRNAVPGTRLGQEFIIKKDSNHNIVLEIPKAEENTDYQEYLAWVAEGNTAEAAD